MSPYLLILLILLEIVTSSRLAAQAPPSSGGSAPSPVPSASATGPSSPSAASPSSSSSGDSGGKTMLGQEIPMFDGGSDVLSWNGQHWNVNNQRVFRARFEKYLNAKEQTEDQDLAYQKILSQIADLLAPGNYVPKNLDQAWSLLPKASNFDIDAKLCDSLANAVYTVWQTQNEVDRLTFANRSLEKQRSEIEDGMKWDQIINNQRDTLDRPDRSNTMEMQMWIEDQKKKKEMRMMPFTERLLEVKTVITANTLKKDATQLQAKLEFQTLLVQLFLQRRFQHVLIGTQLYRHLFTDGDSKLKLGGEAEKTFLETSGMPPTLGVLDSLSNEAMRDVREGIDAYQYLLSQKELNSATERLMEAFIVGEYMPEVRSLTREKKRLALDYAHKENQLLSAIDVKDYTLAEKLVKEMQEVAHDFDASKPLAAIETARTVARIHLSKVRTAATSGDHAVAEAELKAAMEIWPRNPELEQISKDIFNQADIQQQALNDLDRLISQKNHRQIFEDRIRFIAASALYPEKQEALKKILEEMQNVEGAMIRSSEIAKRGDYAGAWESAEKAILLYPDDPKLNQLVANLTTEAADYVRSLRTAQDLEKKSQLGVSLAWYLKSQKIYPPSEFAQQGIERLVKLLMPEGSG